MIFFDEPEVVVERKLRRPVVLTKSLLARSPSFCVVRSRIINLAVGTPSLGVYIPLSCRHSAV